MLKKKNLEYKRVVGKLPDDEQSRLILWNMLDPESKRLASAEKVVDMKYDELVKWIDSRYKVAHGNLEYKALFPEIAPFEPPPEAFSPQPPA